MATMTDFRVENLTKSVGDKTVFSKIDFIIHPLDRIGLIGVNGTGKTTLLDVISGKAGFDGDRGRGVHRFGQRAPAGHGLRRSRHRRSRHEEAQRCRHVLQGKEDARRRAGSEVDFVWIPRPVRLRAGRPSHLAVSLIHFSLPLLAAYLGVTEL